MRHALLAGLLGCALGIGAAHATSLPFPPSITATVDGDSVNVSALLTPLTPTVADTLTLRIEARARSGASMEWPATLVVGGDLGGMTIAAVRELPAHIDPEGLFVETREFDLEPFLPGEADLGPFEFMIAQEGGDKRPITLPALSITIRPLLADDAPIELVGPKGVVDAPEETAQDLTLIIAGGSAAAVLCAAVGVMVALRRGGSDKADSASERALSELASLEDLVRGESHVGQRPTNERAYTVLSTILRTYIESRFSYRATARTTEEFLRDASDNRAGGLPSEAAEQLRVVLEACDEVKFAGAEPGMAAAGRAIDEVRAFVESFGDQDKETA
jgi:hypothetical protein